MERMYVMTDGELVAYLNRVFGKDRRYLQKALAKIGDRLQECEVIADDIHAQTRQPMQACEGLFEETVEGLNSGKYDPFWIGDVSFYYEVVLNPGLKTGLDFDRKLARRCGGTVKYCAVWVSLLQPLYAMDTWSLTYRSKPPESESAPYCPKTDAERETVRMIRSILGRHGLRRVTKRLANTKVPRAITDCRERGDATVFDCLFSETGQLTEGKVICSDGTMKRPIKGAYRGTEVSWRECHDRRGRLTEAQTSRHFASGDSVIVCLDDKGRVDKVIVSPTSRRGNMAPVEFDVKQELAKRRHPKGWTVRAGCKEGLRQAKTGDPFNDGLG